MYAATPRRKLNLRKLVDLAASEVIITRATNLWGYQIVVSA